MARRFPDTLAWRAPVMALLLTWVPSAFPSPVPGAADDTAGHWAFQPVRRPSLPPVTTEGWARNGVDRFILAELESRGLAPSPQADPATLIRRLHLDLIGLPPSPEVVRDFVADPGEAAWAAQVEALLQSPRFGERWGMRWLGLARYGDSNGYEKDEPRPYAWHWRDWVIDSFNRDQPFDEFTIEQVAGDLLPDAGRAQKLATGFHRNAPLNTAGGTDKEELRVLTIVDRVDATATVWLGLTAGCARCHDHKYDPISQKEYYRLFAFFNDRVDEAELPIPTTQAELAEYHAKLRRHDRQRAKLDAQYDAAPTEQRRDIEVLLKRHKKRLPQPSASELSVLAARQQPPRQTHVMHLGQYQEPTELVTAGTPACLPPLRPRRSGPPDRLDLARWLVAPENPLTARVEANRIWQGLFGIGLVRTPEDFGTRCPPPIHGELLDWLASRLRDLGWSRKSLIREILLSATYRQASHHRSDLAAIDPENRLLARQHRYRLEAELVRDQNLAVAGLLRAEVGGPSFRPELPEGVGELPPSYRWESDPPGKCYRRGLYLFHQRTLVYPMLRIFDREDTVAPCTRRERTNTPLQALSQLNDPLAVAASRALARRVLDTAPAAFNRRLDRAFQLCLARAPLPEETRLLRAHRDRLRSIYQAEQTGSSTGAVEHAVWSELARTVINLDEFLTRE